MSALRRVAPVAAVALAGLVAAGPAVAQPPGAPPSAADVARSWVRDWSRGEETRVCARVAQPLLEQLALASGTSACSGAVASALRAAAAAHWRGASIVTFRAELVQDALARVTMTVRHDFTTSSRVVPDRLWLTRPDGRTGAPWRVASLGDLPFVASADPALDPATLDPPSEEALLRRPVALEPLRRACSGPSVTVADGGGDVRAARPPSRAAGQLLPPHPRGPQFGTILADRPFVFTGPRTRASAARPLNLRSLTMTREADGHACLQVRFAQAPRPDSRLLVRWFEPLPGSDTEGTAGAVELRFDGRGTPRFWFDRSRTAVADPDLAGRYRARVPDVGRSGDVLSIRLSLRDLSAPERFRIALQSASTRASDPAGVPVLDVGDTIGDQATGFEWPSGRAAPMLDAVNPD